MERVKFTFDGYKHLVNTVRDAGYRFCNYFDAEHAKDKVCVLRHDVDFDLQKAAEFAEFEKKIGVQSTYFVLLTADFYNLSSAKSQNAIKTIKECGHEIGLHFDEVVYQGGASAHLTDNILREASIMSEVIGEKIKVVSMHRPSKETLAADYVIPGIINSYSQLFFKDFKYLSDSHMRWRELALDIIKSGQYGKLHLLTHPFWYADDGEKIISDVVGNFIRRSVQERYVSMNENFTDLQEIVPKESI